MTRWRVAAAIAVLGIAGPPAIAIAAQPSGTSTLHVSVNPRTGSAKTHFAISFRAAETTGTFGSIRRAYRITAGEQDRTTGCQSSVTAQAPSAKPGANVRVVLLPRGDANWCAGTFSGAVWDVETTVCLPGKVCPDFVLAPRKVGTFTFRVTRG